jgi:peptidoglycan/xylan/chitin deacetylase (PgdA/CDA1 family)/glycosyltransferase involved in cell wall biosynthesis
MNILQVLSQYEVTGAETFAAALADVQIANGHSVFILSDNFFTPTKATVLQHPIGKRDIAQRISNVTFLKKFIREKKIDVVHAHSRAASWVCYFATRGGNVPLVSSIHYRQHLHFSSTLFSVYGEKRVAVCKSIYHHLNHELKYPLETLALVHNGIDLTKWKFKPRAIPSRSKKIVSYVGRLTGFKGDTLLILVEQVFPRVVQTMTDVEFHVYGSSRQKNHVVAAIEKVNQRMGRECILVKGFCDDVEKVYRESDLIIGSGRVAMEALACGSPVVSIGESNVVGIISEETKEEALTTNFGDLDKRRPIDVENSITAIISALKEPEKISAEWGREFVEENFDINEVSRQMSAVYAEAVARKKGINEIPVLLYNGVTADEGNEKIISASEFERQLQFLKEKQFTPLNFFDLNVCISFHQHLPPAPVLLTLMGSEETMLNAFPLLKSYNYTAVFFVQTNEITNPSLIRKIVSLGFEIGSASVTGRKMNLLSDEEIQREIGESKNTLEQITGRKIISFAYPQDYVNEKIKQMAAGAGYLFGVCVDEGRRNFWADLLKIRRIQIFHGSSTFSFWKKTSGRYLWYKNVY